MALVLYVGVTFVQVWLASRRDEARAADAIIVLGAAQYDGEPSPVLAARLDHAANLYRRGLAPLIVVTGGRQEGDRYTEAGAGAAYLERLRIPGTAIERETTSAHSWESLAAAARFLQDDGIERVLLVSDPYHSFRIDAIADDLGLEAFVSPTPSSPVGGGAELRAMARETAAVAVGRVIGYRRLLRLG
ncbi:MAG: YdcF family protein [Acidimicrobiales bacterium]